MRILAVIGTRPEAVKMLPLIKELKKHKEFEILVCFSGQHRDLADNVFELFGITPDYRFSGLNDNRTLKKMTITLLDFFDAILKVSSPELVLVHGDTTTAFCASLAAFYLDIKVAHIEAGLRTFNRFSPYPEEFNRVAIDSISCIHFAPTEDAAKNLKNEGITSVYTTGNTGIDTFKYTLSNTYSHPFLTESIGKKLIIITTHRRENLGENMTSALLGIKDALESKEDVLAILPLHPNPQIKECVKHIFNDIKNIKICPPLPLYDFHNLLSRCDLVISDSGGIQEEASFLGIPLFLLRNLTERNECVSGGNTKIIGTDRNRIKKEISKALEDRFCLENMKKKSLAFGSGNASEKIVKNLLSLL